MRVNCTAEGFEHNWVEVVDSWSRREIVELEGFRISDNEEFFAMLQRKSVACNIVLEDGTVIDDPQRLNYEELLDADEAIWAWLGQCMWIAIGMRRALGNASARLSSGLNGQMVARKQAAN